MRRASRSALANARIGAVGAFAAAVAGILVSCGSPSSNAPPVATMTTLLPTPAPSASPATGPTAPAVPTPAPFATVQNAPFPAFASQPSATATPIAFALPAAAGFSGTLDFPVPIAQIASGATLSEILTSIPPEQVNDVLTVWRALAAGDADTALIYVGLTPSATIAVTSTLGFVFALPQQDVIDGASYYLAFYDPTNPTAGWQRDYAGPAVVNGTTLSFPSAYTGTLFVFAAQIEYWFGLYARSDQAAPPTPVPGSASPTPQPSLAPTPLPSPTPVPSFPISPTTIAFTAPGQTASIAVNAPGAAGALSATSSNPAVATVTQTDASDFLVTAGATAGSTTITVSGSSSGSATVTVGLTVTTGTFY